VKRSVERTGKANSSGVRVRKCIIAASNSANGVACVVMLRDMDRCFILCVEELGATRTYDGALCLCRTFVNRERLSTGALYRLFLCVIQ